MEQIISLPDSVKQAISNDVSIALQKLIVSAKEPLKGQAESMSIDEFLIRLRRFSNNKTEMHNFITSNSGRITINNHELLELISLIKESIEDYNYLSVAKSGVFLQFLIGALLYLENQIKSSDSLYDREKRKKLEIINKWGVFLSSNFRGANSFEFYCVFDQGKKFVICNSKGLISQTNLAEPTVQKESESVNLKENELKKMLDYAIQWWINILQKNGCNEAEISRFREALSLKLPGVIETSGYVDLSTDSSTDQLLENVFLQAKVRVALPERLEMLINDKEIVVREGFNKPKIIFAIGQGLESETDYVPQK
jgi:hypothetical protein